MLDKKTKSVVIKIGLTISEKILASASGKKEVTPGEFVTAKPDLAVNMDTFFPFAIEALKKVGISKVWNPNKVVVNIDHKVPPESIAAAEKHKVIREFVKAQAIKYFYDIGRHGITHQLMVERGHARPGMLYVADDTHATTLGALGAFAVALGFDILQVLATGTTWFKVPESIKFKVEGNLSKGVMSRDIIQRILGDIRSCGALYKAMEFVGSTIDQMNIEGRMTLCNTVNNAGAKTGIINPDQKTIDYVRERTKEPFREVRSDHDAYYDEVFDYEISKLEPQVAIHPNPVDVKPVTEIEGLEIDQGFIGSCASGRMEDLYIAAKILRNFKVHPNVRMLVVPSSQEVYLSAMREGLTHTLIQAGAIICAPSCGPCFGLWGVLGDKETCISTSVLNSPGRMGSHKAKIYLASAATVAASAIQGKITDPRDFVKD